MPNYRGSTGQGEAALSSLLGKAGENDVADCFAALVDALNKNAQLDAGAVYVFGGSHGGFLGAHQPLSQKAPLELPLANRGHRHLRSRHRHRQ